MKPDYFRTVAALAHHGAGSHAVSHAVKHAQSLAQQYITHPSLPVMAIGSLIVGCLIVFVVGPLLRVLGGRSRG